MKRYNLAYLYNGRYIKDYGLNVFNLWKSILIFKLNHIVYEYEVDK